MNVFVLQTRSQNRKSSLQTSQQRETQLFKQRIYRTRWWSFRNIQGETADHKKVYIFRKEKYHRNIFQSKWLITVVKKMNIQNQRNWYGFFPSIQRSLVLDEPKYECHRYTNDILKTIMTGTERMLRRKSDPLSSDMTSTRTGGLVPGIQGGVSAVVFNWEILTLSSFKSYSLSQMYGGPEVRRTTKKSLDVIFFFKYHNNIFKKKQSK